MIVPPDHVSGLMEVDERQSTIPVSGCEETILWEKCRQCAELVFVKTLIRNLYTCPHCQYNNPLPADQRIGQILNPVECKYQPTKPSNALAIIGFGRLGQTNAVILSDLPRSVKLASQAFDIAKERQCPFITFLPNIIETMDKSLSAADLTFLALKRKELGTLLCVTVLTSTGSSLGRKSVSQNFYPNFPLGDIVIFEQSTETPKVEQSDNGFIDKVSSRRELPQLLKNLVTWSLC